MRDYSHTVQLLVENYHEHFRQALKRFNVSSLREMNREVKRKFFNHVRDTWRSRKNSPLK